MCFSCNHSNNDLFTSENNMLSSHVKISCFRAKDHLVFHWCFYYKVAYCVLVCSVAEYFYWFVF